MDHYKDTEKKNYRTANPKRGEHIGNAGSIWGGEVIKEISRGSQDPRTQKREGKGSSALAHK